MERWGLFGLGAIAGVSFLWLSAIPGLAQTRLEVKTTPLPDSVIPFHAPMTVTVQATDGAGLSLDDAAVQVKVLAPARTPWLTTDFPVVEGTTLLDMAIAPSSNTAQFQFMPPIRGAYQLEVAVTPERPGLFEPFTETLALQVPENPEKYHNLLILMAILGVVGVGGGWVIGGSQRVEEGEIAPQPVRLLLSSALIVALVTVLYIAITTEMAKAHESHSVEINGIEAESNPVSSELNVELTDLAIAKVGQAIPLEVEVTHIATGQPVPEMSLAITTQLQAYEQTVAAFNATSDSSGRYSWKQQFFDGSPHLVTVRVSPQPKAELQFEPFEVVKTINVEAIEPPLSARFISLSYLTAFLAAGVGTGFWARRRVQGSGLPQS